ncbi:M23 family metallopeptidase [Paracoccus aestuariivivens]|uniref:Peptidoglycan DD-metalloendopeptidase family protein n=1 Tax=Paracoccus aestuariivivens TaxID=1820333 RepID=A0A6L6J7Y3_9RHOB|nr:M23 family metallopeptidase [Paracoccus aestuariivivens]MTH77305.1 peptidoglycan DD-metalloendopeptidase family protein [Paracoccus aestuariivivens]
MRITHSLNSVLERWLPEQRLFLKSDSSTRFVRLSPAVQLVALGGAAVLFGWTIIASSILAIDAISAQGTRDHARRSQGAFEARLTDLSTERDARAAEAVAAQNRFTVALDQVSDMQSQLLDSEARRRELETGMDAIQSSLQVALKQRDDALGVNASDSKAVPLERTAELQAAFDILSGELKQAVDDRSKASVEATEAKRTAEALTVERDQIIAHNDEIMSQLEDAVTISVKPLDEMFRNVGMNPDDVLKTIRRGYSGEGGPLNPVSYSSSGDAAISQGEAKAKEIMITLDKMNTYRIAVEKMPLAMPVKSAFRYTSPFGRRWGRAHEGIDMAAPVGTPIYSTAEGTVIYAGRMGAYGNLIKIQHEMGVETRFGHLSKIKVKVGQKVSRGSLIGAMGSTGRSTGPHLHYEVRVNGRAMNPMTFIKAAQNVF